MPACCSCIICGYQVHDGSCIAYGCAERRLVERVTEQQASMARCGPACCPCSMRPQSRGTHCILADAAARFGCMQSGARPFAAAGMAHGPSRAALQQPSHTMHTPGRLEKLVASLEGRSPPMLPPCASPTAPQKAQQGQCQLRQRPELLMHNLKTVAKAVAKGAAQAAPVAST